MLDEDGSLYKYMTVQQLRDTLSDPRLQPTDLLVPNAVRNLAVYRVTTEGRVFIGFVDFALDELSLD